LWGIRIAVLVALVPVVLYAVARLVGLVGIPETLDGAVGHIRSYNPGLPETATFDLRATRELAALARIDTSLARVRGIDATASAQLRQVVGRIRTDLQPLLNRTDVNVPRLVGSLDHLGEAVASVRDPSTTPRPRCTAIEPGWPAPSTPRAVARQVHTAGRSARRSADDVSGPRR
jgi:hypothetical protein